MRLRARPWNFLLEDHDPSSFAPPIDREEELQALISALRKPGSIVELVAPVGMGKTALLMMLAGRQDTPFDGTIEFFSGHSAPSLFDAGPEISNSFRTAGGHNLLIVDDADMLDRSMTAAAISLLGTGFSKVSTLLASQNGLGLGQQISIRTFPFRAFREFLNQSMSSPPSEDTIRELWQMTGGRPAVVNAFLQRWLEGTSPNLSAFIETLAPWEFQGLVSPDGRPLSAADPRTRQIITDVRDVDDEMLHMLGDNPEAVFQLSPRKFEELVAELLQRRGYEVALTPPSRDGGRDIHAVRHNELGSFLYLVEAKRYAPHKPVGVEVVRSLYGVTQLEQATAGIVVTTSRFSKPARELAQRVRHQMSLRDYLDLRRWLEEYRANVRTVSEFR